jgi:hypothetical protein
LYSAYGSFPVFTARTPPIGKVAKGSIPSLQSRNLSKTRLSARAPLQLAQALIIIKRETADVVSMVYWRSATLQGRGSSVTRMIIYSLSMSHARGRTNSLARRPQP